jgi:LmbE family N-acetylglucosaminyl deacetylase
VLGLRPPEVHAPLRVLALGAHADDIEIGCSGTLLQLENVYGELELHWVVLGCPTAERAREAELSARHLLGSG